MGRRKFRLTAPKNWERRKYDAKTIIVSIPLALVTKPSLNELYTVFVSEAPSIKDWSIVDCGELLRVYKISCQQPLKVAMTIEIKPSMEWTLFIGSSEIKQCSSPVLRPLKHPIMHARDVLEIVRCVDRSALCIGNCDEAFIPLATSRKGVFKDSTGSQVAYYDEGDHTIRHSNCQLLLPSSGRCQQCTAYRNNTLRREANRLKQKDKENHDPSDPSSHVNYRFLDTPQRNKRIEKLHNSVRMKTRSLQVMRKNAKMIQTNSLTMDSDINTDLLSILHSQSPSHSKQSEEESFVSLFWQQQRQALTRKSQSMKWHPLLIKWCLLLYRKSSGTYDAIRKTGILRLPNTLYWNFNHDIVLFCIVASFLELVPLLLKLPMTHYFLSAKLNQDPLEKFFGRVRQFGRVNDNPKVDEMLKATQCLRVINGIHLDDITGNCRGRKRKGILFDDVAPLPKRKCKRNPSV